MGILSNVFQKFSPEYKNRRQSRDIAQKLHDTHVKYATEKDESETEVIIGRDGHLNITDGNIFELTFGVNSAFRFEIDKMSIWEFMSLDGAVVSGIELNTGRQRSFTVYYDRHLVR